MHAKYQVAIFNIAKVMTNVKVCANKPTNRQGKNNNTGKSPKGVDRLFVSLF